MKNDSTLLISIGENIAVRENVEITINCSDLIENIGPKNYTINWIKDEITLTSGSVKNVFMSDDKRYCVITATLETAGDYTCQVCVPDDTNLAKNCINRTSSQIVCGK